MGNYNLGILSPRPVTKEYVATIKWGKNNLPYPLSNYCELCMHSGRLALLDAAFSLLCDHTEY